ncbi:hypothetical protein B9Z19DRAFT_129941 [Tuber borchii]|uniref:C2H2-type domain-containing protein n=1 Tax=Tuber borchii TaxID=42251 RepID=A0A2T6ZQW8_TUBBO|nr:hypothetical protein B9Z19DRAFT_129941 [Tuber borchii]
MRGTKGDIVIKVEPDHQKTHPWHIPSGGRPLTRTENLKRYLRTQEQERPYICNHCNETFTQQGDLSLHHSTFAGDAKHNARKTVVWGAEGYMGGLKPRQDQQTSHLVQSQWPLAGSASSHDYDSTKSSHTATPEVPSQSLVVEFWDSMEFKPEAYASKLEPREDKQTSLLALSKSPLAGSALLHDYKATNSSSAATSQGDGRFKSSPPDSLSVVTHYPTYSSPRPLPYSPPPKIAGYHSSLASR